MEERKSSSSISEDKAPDGTALLLRREAIQSFLENPAVALQLYPQLGDDLINFFSQTQNPHMSDLTGEPANGREADFEKWRYAQEWARVYRND